MEGILTHPCYDVGQKATASDLLITHCFSSGWEEMPSGGVLNKLNSLIKKMST